MTFNKLLVLDYPDANLVCTATTDATGGVTISFLYPLLVQSKYYLDGMCTGHVTFKSDATAGRTCTGYTVSLNKLDGTGAITNLGSMTYTFATTYTFTASSYLTVPVFIQLNKAVVNENEKLVLSIQLATTEVSGHLMLSHANDSSCPDIKIVIPYAPTG